MGSSRDKSSSRIWRRCGLLAAVTAGTIFCIVLFAVLMAADLFAAGLLEQIVDRPKTVYLDEHQRQLADRMKTDFNEYFFFMDAKDSARPELSQPEWELKPWTYREKRNIRSIVDWLMHRAPGLVLRASSGGRIALCRLSSFPKSSTMTKSWIFGGSPSAMSSDSSIAFSDVFFFPHGQFAGVVHELVHTADAGEQLSHSKAWVQFAEPTISKIWKEYMSKSSFEAYEFGRKICKEGRWPSLYGCVDLDEALAEYMTAYITGSDFSVSQTFVERFGAGFIRPSADDFRWLSLYRQGRAHSRAKNYDQALADFGQVNKMDPHAVLPCLYLMSCLEEKNRFDEAAVVADEGLANLDSAVPMADWSKLRLTMLRAWLYERNGEYYEATRLTDQILSEPDVVDHILVCRPN